MFTPSFVCNRVKKLEDVKDESEKRRIAGILFYITHLIKFKDRLSMDGVSSAKHHKLPSILSQKFSSMFGATNDTRIPDEKQKLLISYVLVLSLFADDFRSDPPIRYSQGSSDEPYNVKTSLRILRLQVCARQSSVAGNASCPSRISNN